MVIMYPIEHMLAWKTELGHPFRKRQVCNRSSKVHDPIHFLSMFKALYNKGNVYKFQIFFCTLVGPCWRQQNSSDVFFHCPAEVDFSRSLSTSLK